ncbi:winged helix DNA-binding domain-containing protein [Conexibacter sp. JD483]|uniref:winged helix DNA-binding domain-containing protein n=1 Tax=unclassified Conexibacter TaxID=2627773 RepID=UPI00271584B0|nr:MULTISPECIES: winged helix DNA-binding domain-containing protein [unclassified Conexibacter]MDO8189367.1 winged helix DNA-binding domain-containing protein [Conexibacter sp. CPCC 205706]MDO8197356.1 winged helix DNA-binding domain-containing protein [Conexibacter sp. CPCC 205762]MDR9372546.1 winged helix DNA-binding domain-containing protein [Conexibacter sp. JD483]
MSRARTLSDRELTLALLARQLLLTRRPLTAAQAVRRLVALQAQYSPSPYLALHARLDGFAIGDLERSLRRGTVVKATLMRGTLHLVHADAFPAYAAAWLRQARRMRDGRVPELAERAPELAGALRSYLRQPRTTDELRARTRALVGDAIGEPSMLLDYARMSLPLVHVIPSGLWRQHGKFSLVLREDAASEADDDAAAAGTVALVRDYLAAFGPATREDLAAFTFLRYHQLDPALAALSPRRLTDARGRELFDLPRAPLPQEDEQPPVRFLPKWDAAVISHRDRTRILPAGFADVVKGGKNGEVEATYLVDGQVAGIWRHDERDGVATLTLRALTGERDAPGLEQEAQRLLALLAPEASRRELTLTT